MIVRAPWCRAGAWLPAVLAWLALLLPAILAPAQAAPITLPKSTIGGRAIAASSSTPNCGLTSKPNSIAVRLTGKRRTMTLYCSIAAI